MMLRFNRVVLRIHITFNVAPAKMKISLSIYAFTPTKYIYLNRRINYISNDADIKNKNKMYWRKKISKIFKAFEVCREKVQECEVLAMKIISLISLYSVILNCASNFLSKHAYFIAKKVLFLLTITLRNTLLYSNRPYFPKYWFLRKIKTQFCRG